MDGSKHGKMISSELRVLRTKANLLGVKVFQTHRTQVYGADIDGYAKGWTVDADSGGNALNDLINEFDMHTTDNADAWALFPTEEEALRAFIDYLMGKEKQ